MEQLTKTETSELTSLEGTIRKGMGTFIEVGEALMRIRDGRLYRSRYRTFEAYCAGKWGMGKSHAYRLMDASTIANTSPVGDKLKNEAQARELSSIPEALRIKVIRKAQKKHGGKLTARAIREAADEYRKVKPKTVAHIWVRKAMVLLEHIPPEDPGLSKAMDIMETYIKARRPEEKPTEN